MRAATNMNDERSTAKHKEHWERPRLRSIEAREAETAPGVAPDILSAHS